jgi:hypothetical protein
LKQSAFDFSVGASTIREEEVGGITNALDFFIAEKGRKVFRREVLPDDEAVPGHDLLGEAARKPAIQVEIEAVGMPLLGFEGGDASAGTRRG